MANSKLDCKGLSCPMPIVKITKAVKDLKQGDILEVESTDTAFEPDIQAWSKKTGNPVEKIEKDQGIFRVWIRKAA